jgi:reductive dehalogenase
MSNAIESNPQQEQLPFPVADYRFDQKNEMFKRIIWDESMRPLGQWPAEFGEKVGFRKIDYAIRNASGNLEWGAGYGNLRSNFGLYSWDGVPKRVQPWVEAGGPVKESPKEMSRHVKRVAHYFGADLVGICKVHPNWVYSHEFNTMTREHYSVELPEDCHNAIVMAVEMDYETTRMSPNGMGGAATGLGYSDMVYVANLLAVFIRGLGYKALPSGNDTALSIPLAMAAGLGESSRAGFLITREFGPRVRLCKVFTDLPLEYDTYQPFGVEAFCTVCKKCAENCPSQSIPHGDKTREGHNISNQDGVLKWYSNLEKCYAFWSKNRMSCADCIRVCPFNKPKGMIHDMTRSMIRSENPTLNRFFVWIDDIMRYDKPYPATRFWDSDEM